MTENNETKVECPHGEACGACALLGLDYVGQLGQKTGMVARHLRETREFPTLRPLPCIPSPAIATYRNRARMAIGMSRHGRIDVGYFRAGTREIEDAPDCQVILPELLETTRQIRRFLETHERLPRALRHIDVRCGTDPNNQHLILVFHAEKRPSYPIEALLRECPNVDGISVNLNPAGGPQVIRGAVEHIWGEREVWVELGKLRLRVSPASFFQVNLSILPAIHETMSRFFGESKCLADLYAGVGTHGLALHKQFRRILFAEGQRSAVADLKANIKAHNIPSTRIFPKAVERGLDALRDASPDAVILNPARAGVDRSVLTALTGGSTQKIAYLSSDPGTLSRDLVLLKRGGFVTRSVQPVDMMPQTQHVEVLALLERGDRPAGRSRPRSERAPSRAPRGRSSRERR